MMFLGLSVIQLFSKRRQGLGTFFLYLNGISINLKQSKWMRDKGYVFHLTFSV